MMVPSSLGFLVLNAAKYIQRYFILLTNSAPDGGATLAAEGASGNMVSRATAPCSGHSKPEWGSSDPETSIEGAHRRLLMSLSRPGDELNLLSIGDTNLSDMSSVPKDQMPKTGEKGHIFWISN
jgi:hypothetical protein